MTRIPISHYYNITTRRFIVNLDGLSVSPCQPIYFDRCVYSPTNIFNSSFIILDPTFDALLGNSGNVATAIAVGVSIGGVLLVIIIVGIIIFARYKSSWIFNATKEKPNEEIVRGSSKQDNL